MRRRPKPAWKRKKRAPSELGLRIQSLRESAGIEAEELSLAAGLSRTHVHSIEVGWILNPRFETVSQLAHLLGVPLEYLAEGKGRAPSGAAIKRNYRRRGRSCATTT